MIECQHLHCRLHGRTVVKDINWQFEAGQISAIVGPNGAGKSTLLKAMLGIYQTRMGEVHLQGRALESWHIEELAKRRAYMAQASRARFRLPVYEYLALARVHQRESQTQCDTRVAEVIRLLDIAHLASKDIDCLSGGEFQRVELARVWCQLLSEKGVQDTLLLLDEPASALDIRQTQHLYQYLRRFCDCGGTVVVVEHDINLAARFCDQLLMMRKGHLLAAGSMATTFTEDNINRCFDVAGRVLHDHHSSTFSFHL